MVDVDVEAVEEISRLTMKMVFVGEVGTGKTAIIRQYVDRCFTEFYKATIGVDFAHKLWKVSDNLSIDVHLWDIAGEEHLGAVTSMYYKQAVGACVVFDVTNPDTLKMVTLWKADIDEKVSDCNGNPIPCILLGNKIDERQQGWERSQEEMNQFAEDNGFLCYFETSAKTGQNVDAAIEHAIKYALENKITPPYVENTVSIKNKESESRCC